MSINADWTLNLCVLDGPGADITTSASVGVCGNTIPVSLLRSRDSHRTAKVTKRYLAPSGNRFYVEATLHELVGALGRRGILGVM